MTMNLVASVQELAEASPSFSHKGKKATRRHKFHHQRVHGFNISKNPIIPFSSFLHRGKSESTRQSFLKRNHWRLQNPMQIQKKRKKNLWAKINKNAPSMIPKNVIYVWCFRIIDLSYQELTQHAHSSSPNDCSDLLQCFFFTLVYISSADSRISISGFKIVQEWVGC